MVEGGAFCLAFFPFPFSLFLTEVGMMGSNSRG